MECEQARELFSPYLEGELPAEQEDEFRDHLKQCSTCSDRYRSFEEGITTIRTLPRHPIPRSFALGVLDDREGVALRPAPTGGMRWWLSWAATVLIVLLVGVTYLEMRLDRQVDVATRNQQDLTEALNDVTAQLRGIGSTAQQQDRKLLDLASTARGYRDRLESFAGRLESLDTSHDQEIEQLLTTIQEMRGELLAAAARDQAPQDDSGQWRALEEQITALEGIRQQDWQELEQRITGLETTVARVASPGSVDGQRGTALSVLDRASNDRLPPDLPSRVRRNKGRLSLQINWNHPDAVASLFELHDFGSAGERRLALTELERLFEGRVRPVDRSKRSGIGEFLDGVLGTKSPVRTPEDEERQRVERYRENWEKSRNEDVDRPGTADRSGKVDDQ